MVKPVPDGYHAVTPSLMFKDSRKAIEFYQKAFGAEVLDIFPNPGGDGTMHAVIRIGDSILMMGDEIPGVGSPSAETLGDSPISLFIYVEDVDAVFNQSVAAGGTAIMPVAEMFWGDRAGTVKDPFGYQWMIGTHMKDLTREEIRKGAEAFLSQAENKQ